MSGLGSGTVQKVEGDQFPGSVPFRGRTREGVVPIQSGKRKDRHKLFNYKHLQKVSVVSARVKVVRVCGFRTENSLLVRSLRFLQIEIENAPPFPLDLFG
jgi:hypothetical protein